MIVHMIGNAHIDPVWLWPWPAGVDEALATFRSAADRCDEYPDFVFTRGEAWLYAQVERLDPALFARVRRLVARGRWRPTGGMWVQPDANLPTQEGWRRQLLRGRRYFQEHFDVEPTVGYNVDTFGHPATLPDILAGLGYRAYVFHRPSAHQVALPAQAFRWRGSGGGEVIGFRITPAYVTRTHDLYGQVMLALDAADPALGHTMCFYGVGNHGGGPTKRNIEYILEHQHAFPGVELRFSTPEAFFDAIAPRRDHLPVVTEELQRTFPGCYSVMHDIKGRQRRGEHLLARGERLVDLLVDDASARDGLRGRLDAAWDDLLFTQFHDVLAGTSIPSAWEAVRAMQGRALLAAEEATVEATRRWARRALPQPNYQQIVVINADEAPWAGLVETEPFLDFDAWGRRWLSDLDGRPVPYQMVYAEAPESIVRVVFPLALGPGKAAQALVRDDAPPTAPPTLMGEELEVSSRGLANGRLRVELGDRGIGRLLTGGRDILGEGGIGLHLRRDRTDTWTFHADHFRDEVEVTFRGGAWVVEERGPLRARVHTEGWLGHSRVRWTVSLCRDDPRLYMDLEVLFAERFRLLQMPVRLTSAPASWVDGQAGGHVERRPGPTEWPVQGWSRVDTGDRAVALVTDDAYSLSVEGDVWQWTLLRSPKMAWGGGAPEGYAGRAVHTDQGPHTFRFVLYVGAGPGAGDRLDPAALRAAARQAARPPVVFDRYEGMDRPPWGDKPPRHMWTGAEQRALADGRMAHVLDRGAETAVAAPPPSAEIERE